MAVAVHGIIKIKAARAAHEANRVYCLGQGETTQKSWDQAAVWQRDSAMKGVQLIVDEPNTTPEQLHNSWMEEKEIDGWVFGRVKDAQAKIHPCMVPYAELPESQRLKDDLFQSVVRAVLFG